MIQTTLDGAVQKIQKELKKELVSTVRKEIGPHASPDKIHFTPALPKTRSGKILRGTIQKIADNVEYVVPATIDDPTILPEMEDAVQVLGFGKARKD